MSVSRRKTELNQKLKKLQKKVVDGPAGPHLRVWCDRMVSERKNWIIISLAQLVVRSVDGLYLLEEITRNGMTDWLKPIPPLDEWEQMYRRPCPAIQRAYDCFFNVPQDLCDLIGVPEEMGPVGCGTAVRERDMFEAFNAAARDRGLKRDVLRIDEDAFGKRIDREKRFRTAAAWDIFCA